MMMNELESHGSTATKTRPGVIFVDDDPMVLTALRRVLRREPYSLLTTEDPKTALQWLEEGKAEVLITDLWMPGMTGTELLRRARGCRPHVRAAILTAQPDTNAVIKRCQGDIRKLITKPWNEGELKRTIRELVGSQSPEEEKTVRDPEVREGTPSLRTSDLSGLYRRMLAGDEDALNVLREECRRHAGEPAVAPRAGYAGEVASATQSIVQSMLSTLFGIDSESAFQIGLLTAWTGEVVQKAVERSGSEARLEAGQRKIAESHIKDAENRYRLLLEGVRDYGIFLVDERGQVASWNAGAQRIYGYEAEEIIGKTRRHLSQAKGATAVLGEESLRKATTSGSSVEEGWRLRKDGSRFWAHSILTAMPPIAGRLGGFLEITRDTTEHRTMMESLKRERDFISAVLETAEALVTVLDKDGKIVRFNRACERASGYSSEEVQGKPFWDLLAVAEEAESFKAGLAGGGERRLAARVETSWKTKSGQSRRIAWSNAWVADPAAGTPYVIATGIDVTDHKRLEEQVSQNQKMEAMGRLAGGVAHDFNNLLTVIVGYGDLLLSKIAPEHPQRDLIQEMRDAGQRGAALTRQLLTFSRKHTVDPVSLDLNTAVSSMEKMLQRVIGADVEVVLVKGADLGRVMVDPGQIEQVLMNLVVNARDAMPQGGRITIETANVELDAEYGKAHLDVRPGPHVMVSVSDTGIGMSAETQSRIFEPFFTTKEEGKGTGLGLATVHGIVKQGGGHIWLYSELGHGTTFKVYFPRIADAARSAVVAPAPARPPGGTETVLLVEDSNPVRLLARRILENAGYKILEASDGKEAEHLSMSHAGPIDILVTDSVMPGVGGGELAKRILLRRPGLKVLHMSGYSNRTAVEKGLVETDGAFLQKPFSKDALLSKVREMLDRKSPESDRLPSEGDRP